MQIVRLLLVVLLLIGASTAAGRALQTAALQDVRFASCMMRCCSFLAGGAQQTGKCVVTRRWWACDPVRCAKQQYAMDKHLQ
jgi:hypothetical protein